MYFIKTNRYYNTFMLNPPLWSSPPASLHAERDWVHVFRLALDLPDPIRAGLGRLLSPDEQARGARYMREIDRQRFTTARGQLRRILGAYSGMDPVLLRFTYNPQGKPALDQGEPHFNLSHSRGCGLLAVIFGRESGVDIETDERNVDYTNIARRFFSPTEAAALLALPADVQPRAFLNGWTRKEAYIKARGQGLSIPLDSFDVSLDDTPRLTCPDGNWSLYTLEPGNGFSAALVVEGEIAGIRCWDWKEMPSGERPAFPPGTA